MTTELSTVAAVAVNPASLPAFTAISHGTVVPALGLVFTGGQVAWDATGRPVGADLAAQFRQTWANLDAVLEAAGTSRRHVVKETIFLVGYTPDRFPEVAQLIAAVRPEGVPAPASTCVGVETLFADSLLVEIEAVAVLPSSSAVNPASTGS
ncbi:RidA family protein [Blastococcus montanus]|uniref:RidA family protein n=1 Tax=Blastococcus montanus TaxID=3144973 RepID=UPI00320A7075